MPASRSNALTHLPARLPPLLARRLDEFVTHEFKGVESVIAAVDVMRDPAIGALRPVITY
jgi:hypothetical protein